MLGSGDGENEEFEINFNDANEEYTTNPMNEPVYHNLNNNSTQNFSNSKNLVFQNISSVNSHPEHLEQNKLTYVDGVAVLVGIIIGSGVFSSPGLALERCGSPGEVLIAWCTAGFLVSMSSHCYLELGSMMPTAGGDFDYLKRAYGDRVAFSFAWYNFFVGKPGSQAIIATIFGRYFQAVVEGNVNSVRNGDGDEETPVAKITAIILLIVITILNCAGIKESATLSIVLTVTKIILCLSIFFLAIAYSAWPQGGSHLSSDLFDGSNGIVGFGSALVACLWSFDGFADANFLQEELTDPIRDLPRIVTHGVIIVTICYLLINVAYLSALPSDTIEDSNAITVEFGFQVSSLFRGSVVLPFLLAIGVALSTAGSVNGSIMTGGRAFYANGRAGEFPKAFANLNRYQAPYVSLIGQGLWAVMLLLLPGSNFSTLLDYFGPTSWCFYALTASSLIRLRIKEPNTARPYKVPWYPLPPIVVIVIAIVIVCSSLAKEPLFTGIAFCFVLLSIPAHILMEYHRASRLSVEKEFLAQNVHSALRDYDSDGENYSDDNNDSNDDIIGDSSVSSSEQQSAIRRISKKSSI